MLSLDMCHHIPVSCFSFTCRSWRLRLRLLSLNQRKSLKGPRRRKLRRKSLHPRSLERGAVVDVITAAVKVVIVADLLERIRIVVVDGRNLFQSLRIRPRQRKKMRQWMTRRGVERSLARGLGLAWTVVKRQPLTVQQWTSIGI